MWMGFRATSFLFLFAALRIAVYHHSDREGERDRETERQRDRETERQRETERDRERQRETERQRDRETERQREMYSYTFTCVNNLCNLVGF